ncbi:hypothetical protein A3B63_00650 [Candidatus Saccharibacteria bacterium RIFCSPLOWO2_01_FULL_49_22]|nr:MAG: hypothetical protein A3B63_00650 [Candidatus Saccharibacteria bacterium RIFCSPLOWO2_01_FULL_49_22]
MSGLLVCIGGVLIILIAVEIIWRYKLLKGELQRKFAHITGGIFVAFWPWLVSWRTIQLLGLAMLVGASLNRYRKFSHFADGVHRESYGEIFSALAITLCAVLTNEPIIFAIAILHLALADGLAAVIGNKFGRKWRYEVFGQEKTIIGTMTFWIVSVIILGIGLLYAAQFIDYETYSILLIVLPPLLAALENLAVYGSDNIVVPVATIVALQGIQSF